MVSSFRKIFGMGGIASLAGVLLGVVLLVVGAAVGSSVLCAVAVSLMAVSLALLIASAIRSLVYGQRTLKSNLTKRLVDIEQATTETASAVGDTREQSQEILASVKAAYVGYGNSASAHSYYAGVGADYMLADRSRRGVPNMGSFALTSGSQVFRDVLSLAATGMQYRTEDLLELVRCWQGGLVTTEQLAPLKRNLNAKSLLVLAAVLQHQQATLTDSQDATYMFRLAHRFWGLKYFSRQQRFLALESELCLPTARSIRRIASEYGLRNEKQQLRLLAANEALKSFTADQKVPGEDLGTWLAEVNSVFTAAGFAPVALDSEDLAPIELLDHIQPASEGAPDGSLPVSGPMVSVIVPTFRPSDQLTTAVRSLLNQTYRDLEIIVVDDGSGDQYSEILNDVEMLDPRVRVLRQPKNQGAYPSRNAGVAISTGEFITVHDDDDWSHPEKIAAQVGNLLSDPELPANMSSHVRLTDSGQFVRINVNAILTQPNYSSLMFRRSVLDRLGPWQSLRKGGDSEYKERIDSVYNIRVPVLLRAPLSFTRTATGNLTSGEISRGFISSDRRWFANLHRIAQARSKDRGDNPRELAIAHHATPKALVSGAELLDDYDVVYCTDYRFPGGTTALAVAELDLLMRNGYRVAIVQIDSPINNHSTPIAPRVVDFMAANPNCDVISLKDAVNAALVIVRQPGLLDYADGLTSNVTAQSGAIIANTTPVFPGGANVAFNLQRDQQNFERLFGCEGLVYPESPVTRRLLEKLGYGPLLESNNWPGMAPAKFAPSPLRHSSADRPTVGRHGRDHRDKWPETLRTLAQTYFNPDAYDTAILGGIDEIPYEVPERMLERTEVFAFGAVPPEEFLKGIDFFVHYPSTSGVESFGMATVEALASGRVCILPPYMEPTFGEAALYAEPEDVAELIADVWSDPERYAEQARKGVAFVDANFRGQHLLHLLGTSDRSIG